MRLGKLLREGTVVVVVGARAHGSVGARRHETEALESAETAVLAAAGDAVGEVGRALGLRLERIGTTKMIVSKRRFVQ